MKKRVLSLLLLVILLSSCGTVTEEQTVGNDAGTVKEKASAETEPETESIAPEVQNMNGAVLTILNYTPESFNWANTQIFASDLTGETLNDALYQREQKLEQDYNCSLEELASGDVLGTLQTSVTAGDSDFDTAMLFDAQVSNMLSQGLLMSWDELNIDLSEPWWDGAATEQYNFKGIQAAVSGAFSLYNYSTRHCYVFNEDLLTITSPETDLYGIVRDGAWTLDRMYELAELAVSDLDGDGTMTTDNDRYGIVSSVTRHYSALLAGSDVKYIERNNSGDLYFNITGNEYAIDVMSKLVRLNAGNDIFTSGTNDIGGGAESPIFYADRALFIAAYVGEAARMRDIEFNIGIVPAPKYSEEQRSYYSLVEGGAQSILPKTLSAEAREKTAVLLDAFGYYSYVESIPAYIDQVLMSKTARSKESAEMMQLVFDTSFYDLGTGAWSAETKNQFTQNVFLPKSDTITSLCQQIDTSVNNALESFMKKLTEE